MRKHRWPFIAVGTLLILYSIFTMIVSNFNIGVVIPAVLGVPLVIFGVLRNARFFHERFGKFLKIFCGICYLLFIAAFITFSIFVSVAANKEPEKNADAIIVLGAALHGSEPTLTLKNRLNTAIAYANENPDTLIVVTGGQGPQEDISEAQAMANYLVENGISETRIVQERSATSTYENFVNSKALLNKIIGPDVRIVFVTNDFHIIRAEQTARAAGFSDVSYMASRSVWYMRPSFYCREMVAFVLYQIFGLTA